MAEATTTEKYPHVYDWQRPIVEKYGYLFNNTGGNDPLDLLNDLNNEANKNFAATNIVRFTLAVAVQSQVHLMAHLEQREMLK